MAKVTWFLAGAAVGVAVGAVASSAFRLSFRSVAKNAVTGYYAGKRRVVELASLVSEEVEDLRAEVLSEEEAQAAAPAANMSADVPAATAESDELADELADEHAPSPAAANGNDPIGAMTIAQLRNALRELGISIGKRAKRNDLISRLRAATSEA